MSKQAQRSSVTSPGSYLVQNQDSNPKLCNSYWFRLLSIWLFDSLSRSGLLTLGFPMGSLSSSSRSGQGMFHDTRFGIHSQVNGFFIAHTFMSNISLGFCCCCYYRLALAFADTICKSTAILWKELRLLLQNLLCFIILQHFHSVWLNLSEL